MKKIIVIMFIFIISNVYSGESLFGISTRTLGMVSVPYSASGIARSYQVANYDSLQMNYTNYSMWANMSKTSYTVSMGYRAAFGDDGIESDYFNDVGNYQGGSLGFPVIKKRLAMGIALIPSTDLEQRIAASDERYDQELLIKGGLSKAVINVSYNFLPNTGIGLGYEYNFGKIGKDYRLVYLNTSLEPLVLSFDERFYGHGLVFSGHSTLFEKLSFGFLLRPAVTIDKKVKGDTNSNEVNSSIMHEVTLPTQLNFGLEYKMRPRLSAGVDVIYHGYEKGYKVDGNQPEEGYNDYFRIGAGIERRQSPKLFTSLGEKIDYRLGFFYTQLNHQSNGNAVNEYGLSMGFSVPIHRFRSRIDFSGIIGKRGNLDKNAYEETFFGLGVSISASEIWFVNIDD